MTPYAFFSGPRKYSPIVSSFQMNPLPSIGVEWRTDYDTSRHRITNSGLLANFRHNKYTLTAGHNQVRSVPALSPSANQVMGMVSWGRSDTRGLSLGFQTVYDFRTASTQFMTTQATYNSDCCGISVQFRRVGVGLGVRNDFRVAFAVANIGSFGSLRRQERVF
jgi:LPS-assembly protein